MTFQRENLPEAVGYFENHGLALKGPGKWKTTSCTFHGGSDSMRVNTGSGAWVCMSCGAKGGDVLAYEMQFTGAEFIDACKALGAWVNDGRAPVQQKPSSLTPRQALSVLAFESTLAAVAAGNTAKGVALSGVDLARLMTAARRINQIAEALPRQRFSPSLRFCPSLFQPLALTAQRLIQFFCELAKRHKVPARPGIA